MTRQNIEVKSEETQQQHLSLDSYDQVMTGALQTIKINLAVVSHWNVTCQALTLLIRMICTISLVKCRLDQSHQHEDPFSA